MVTTLAGEILAIVKFFQANFADEVIIEPQESIPQIFKHIKNL